jgi:hypothetical protein
MSISLEVAPVPSSTGRHYSYSPANISGPQGPGGVRVRDRSSGFGRSGLLCTVGIAAAECTQDNAIDVIAMSQAPNELFFMQNSMMGLASLAVQARPNEDWKFVCIGPQIPGPVLVGERDDAQDQVSAPLP